MDKAAQTPDPRAPTQRRILDAATREFAEHGFAGARISKIAEGARANQRMIYAYFLSKADLFQAVLDESVAVAQEAVLLEADDLVGYALQLFDFYRDSPALARLALWQELELDSNVRELSRAQRELSTKIEKIREAQASGRLNADIEPQALLDAVQALTLGNLVGHGFDWTPARRELLRAAVASLIR